MTDSLTDNKMIPQDYKVWRNPMNLFRGAEYSQLLSVMHKEPLTFYDMNFSAQDHQTFFTCESDSEQEDMKSKFVDL